MNRALLLSIRPKFVDKIMNGFKTVELRRVRPNIVAGDSLLIYASSPEKKLVALSVVCAVNSDSPQALWFKFSEATGLTLPEFEDYFCGAEVGFAITFNKIKKFETPITLSLLKKIWPGFKPPQIYRYLSPEEYSNLINTCAVWGRTETTV
jgi:predicted transcriptional regulator